MGDGGRKRQDCAIQQCPSRSFRNRLQVRKLLPTFPEFLGGRAPSIMQFSQHRYLEAIKTGKGWSGWMAAVGVTASLYLFGLILAVPPLRSLAFR